MLINTIFKAYKNTSAFINDPLVNKKGFVAHQSLN